MPESVADLAAALRRYRSGHGRTELRVGLRERLAKVDGQLRTRRNAEKQRLAELQSRLHRTDTRDAGAFTALQRAAEASAARLAVLDGQIIDALRRLVP